MQIFLSYAHDERSTAFISRLKTQLRTSQIPAWVDFIDIKPGESWMASIDDAIRDSFALIIVLTPASSRSEYVTYEWSWVQRSLSALASATRVLPPAAQVDSVDRLQPRRGARL